MAAKQGLTAHLSQASEDAKRSLLTRTGANTWFSHLNTTCTIKSAPPRTPEVLQKLAVQTGWLYKRNEQHHWQARWCCVVPHMFLYYFDAAIDPPPQPTTEQMEEWNGIIQNTGKPHEKRSSLYLFKEAENSENVDNSKFLNVQPAGIIDLECYTSVHRKDKHLMELAGDETVNPDLRHFYFCANNEKDAETWQDALLHQRHSQLVDECDAYKQVCDGFAQQLQELHTTLDDNNKTIEDQEKELYAVRSQQEEVRRQAWRIVEEHLENNPDAGLQTQLDRIKSQMGGILQITNVLLHHQDEIKEENKRLQEIIENRNQETIDINQTHSLEKELEDLKRKHQEEKASWESSMKLAEQKLALSQAELADVQQNLQSTKMQVHMHSNQQNKKYTELQQHKKILKKEVLELRQKLDDSTSELNLLRHQNETTSMRLEQERSKSQLLERYVEKIENQVKVQQNMMEMMSQAGSVPGSVIGSMREPVPRRRYEDDAKSHVSELTEDRTQRHLEAYEVSGRARPPNYIFPPRPEKSDKSVASGRMSVAQKARIEADRQSTPVKARINADVLKDQQKPNILERLGQRLVGDVESSDSDSDSESVNSTRVTDYTDDVEEKKTDVSVSMSVSNLSLAERSRLQREQQLNFLRRQGLIKSETDVPLGAGSDVASHASSSHTERV